MSSDADRKQRMAELEARRKRLEDIKKRKTAGGGSGAGSGTSDANDILNEIDSLISAGAPKPTDVPSIIAPSSADSTSSSSPTTATSSASSPSVASASISINERLKRLSLSEVDSFEVPPKVVVQYDRDTQTETKEEIDDPFALPSSSSSSSSSAGSGKTPNKRMSLAASAGLAAASPAEPVAPAKPEPLTEEQQSAIMASEQFHQFFDRASLLVERVLSANQRSSFDPFVDYAHGGDDSDDSRIRSKDSTSLFQRHVLIDESKVLGRPITSIDWSPKYDELLLCSYAERSSSSSALSASSSPSFMTGNEPDGVVLIWNLNMTSRPEFQFFCQSAVLSASFHPHNPKLVVGGTYSGQLVLWDTREKNTPVHRSSLAHGHTHPVYSLSFAPSSHQKSASIVSVCNAGKLCTWNGDMLVDPLTEVVLSTDATASSSSSSSSAVGGKDDLSISCMTFPTRENNAVYLGADDGRIFKSHVFDKTTEQLEVVQAHDAPITGIDCHPQIKDVHGGSQLSDLFLTSSCDWSIKLWSSKVTVPSSSSASSALHHQQHHSLASPLFKFDVTKDYVFDVKWSPSHPAVFASVDGQGSLDLWNLNSSQELPVARQPVYPPSSAPSSSSSSSASPARAALSRCRWSRSGKQIAVGDCEGRLYVYDVAPEMCEFSAEESMSFMELMHKTRSDALAQSSLSSSSSSSSSSSRSSRS